MSFNEITKIEMYQFYIDLAFKNARTSASGKKKGLRGDRITKTKFLELIKLEAVEKTLVDKLLGIISTFPNFDNLTEFYTELVKTLIDFKDLKKSLGAMNWGAKKISEFTRQYRSKIQKTKDQDSIKKYSKEFFGRISSVLRQIRRNFAFLEETRKTLRDFPSIKDGLFTIAITGFPNIGKTTLLSKITGSRPEIKAYAFTTKNLNIGYIEHNNQKIQFIDTPGTLNRDEKMNEIEKVAELAIKYCAHMIIYVYDLTEPYPLKDQKELLRNLNDFDKPIVIYLSKTDILDKKVVSEFRKKNKVIVDLEELKEKILEEFKYY